MNGTVDVETSGDIAILRMSSGSRNHLTQRLRSDLVNAFRQIKRMSGLKAIVLTGRGAYFSAGLDQSELETAQLSPTVADVATTIEDCPLPVIAALQGPALDGGLELALAAHYRVAAKSVLAGFEAIKLGLLPSGGATQRLPRLIGAKNSLTLFLGGRRLPAKNLGLVFDALLAEPFEAQFLSFAQDLVKQGKPVRQTREASQGFKDPAAFQAAIKEARQAHQGSGQAALDIVRCVEAANLLPFEAGLALEQDAFEASLTSDISLSYRHLLKAEAAARDRAARMDEDAWDIHRLAILGNSRTVVGLASVCLFASIAVIVIAPEDELTRLRDAILRQVARLLERRGGQATQLEQFKEALELSPKREDAVNCDMVIDLMGGSKTDQLARFEHLASFMPGHSVLATGTAQGGLAELGRIARRSRQVVGIYAYPPVEMVPLVEIAQLRTTSAVVMATVARFVSRLEKFSVLATDASGLIGNAMQGAFFRAAEQLTYAGVDFEAIDQAMRAYGFALGPFQLWDIGRGPRSGRLASAMAEQGLTGRTVHAGFYVYADGQTERPANSHARRIVQALCTSGKPLSMSAAEIQFYCTAAMANEGARLLLEGVAHSPADIDLVMTLGHGFPRHRGGPMMAADLYGLMKLRKRLQATAQSNAFWTPSSLFDELIKNGLRFSTWAAAEQSLARQSLRH